MGDAGNSGIDANGSPDAPPSAAACQLTAVEPRIASTDDKLAIEGTFVGPVTVQFPGGVSVAAVVLGPHRATVTVPATATAGDLTVNACDATLGPIPFRRASFAVGLGSFESTLEQSTGARQTPTLVTSRAGNSVALVGHSLYVMGGVGSAGDLGTVEQASVNADGSLGTFANSASALVTARHGHSSVVIGSYLYVIGGAGDAALRSVERAAIARDGSLGPFSTVSGVALVTARHGHTNIVIGNQLYVIGGAADGILDSVERAIIHGDGSLGPFVAVPEAHLVNARDRHASALVGRSLYVLGGTGRAGLLDDVERASIEPDGSLGPFAPVAGVTLKTARAGHAAAVLGNALYVVGGVGGGGPLASAERAPLDADGLLGAFATSSVTMVAARGDHSTALVGNYLYAIGGASNRALASVERATINVGGQLQPSVAAGVFVVPRNEAATVVLGDFLYVIGGSTTAANTIERAVVHADGSLDAFATVQDIALLTPRRSHTLAVIASYLYVIGGTGPAGAVNTVERATVSADGSLGPFTAVYALSSVRTTHTSVVIGDYLYLLGGADAGGPLNSIERVTIDAAGALVSSTTFPAALTVPHGGRQNVVIRSSLFVLGGQETTVERASINPDGTLSTFATVPNVAVRTDEHFEATATVVGNSLYLLGGERDVGQGEDEAAGISAAGGLSSFAFGGGATRRSGHSTVVLGNQLYLLGGTDGLTNLGVEARPLR